LNEDDFDELIELLDKLNAGKKIEDNMEYLSVFQEQEIFNRITLIKAKFDILFNMRSIQYRSK
jgi:hypothetical protein